jgi:hypothetical protein
MNQKEQNKGINHFGEYTESADEFLKPEHVKQQEEIDLAIESLPTRAIPLAELRIQKIIEFLNNKVGTGHFSWTDFNKVIQISKMGYEELLEK